MINNSDRPIQRTLILTTGPVAEEVGRLVSRQLQEKSAPQEAVTVVSVSSEEGLIEVLTAGLLSISSTNLRIALAGRGWQPVRVDEVIVYLVADIRKTGVSLADIVHHTRQLAQQLLGVNVSVLLLALFPESDGDPVASSWPTQQHKHLFERGTAILGLTNEIGLRLKDNETLVQICCQIVLALTLTPLRDAPEWLTELSGSTNGYMSLGITTWDWSPQAAWEQAAWEWVRQVISQWLANEENGVSLPSSVLDWFNQQQLDPEALTQRLSNSQETTTQIQEWNHPQPWRVRQQLLDRQPSFKEESSIPAAVVEQIQQAARDTLATTIRSLLDGHPVASIAFAGSWLYSFSYQLEDFQDTVAGRQAHLEEQLAATSASLDITRAELDSLLQDWPSPSLVSWMRPLLAPWRWSGLILQYWRLQEMGKRLVNQSRQLQDQQYEEEVLNAISEIYTRLDLDLQRLALQVEEIGEMLRFLQEEIGGKGGRTGQGPELTNALWESLEQRWLHPHQEAVDAAKAIGGLGLQLAQLNDEILGALLVAGRKRMVEVGQMTAVCALLCLHKTPEALMKWWQEVKENAIPLWPYDPARLSDSERNNHNSLTLVCTPRVKELREQLDLPDTADQRWIAGSDPTRIWVLCLRGGIPDGDFKTSNCHE